MKNKTLINLSAAVISAGVLTFAATEKNASKGSVGSSEPDFLIILGCRVRGDDAEPTLKMRICAAADYLHEHKNVKAVCCGGIVHPDQNKSEASVIFESLVKLGIDSNRLYLEDKSRTTQENFQNAKKIIDGLNLDFEPKIAFISSDFHLLRAGYIAKSAGVTAKSISAPSPRHLLIPNYIREAAAFPFAVLDSKR